MSATVSSKVGTNLKRLIKEKFRTQEKFAEKCYRDPRQIRRWIKDGVKSISIINEIAGYLGVDAWALLA